LLREKKCCNSAKQYHEPKIQHISLFLFFDIDIQSKRRKHSNSIDINFHLNESGKEKSSPLNDSYVCLQQKCRQDDVASGGGGGVE
jgi:hypothetical protein